MGSNKPILILGLVAVVLGAFLLTQEPLIQENVLKPLAEQVDNMQSVMEGSESQSGMGSSPVLTIMTQLHDGFQKGLENAKQVMGAGGALIVLAFVIGEPKKKKETTMAPGAKQFVPNAGERVVRRIDLPDRTYIITDHRIIFRPANEEVKVKDIVELNTEFNIYTGSGTIHITDLLGDVRDIARVADVRTINNLVADLMEAKLEVGGLVKRGEKDALA